jgi:hypothetical protein
MATLARCQFTVMRAVNGVMVPVPNAWIEVKSNTIGGSPLVSLWSDRAGATPIASNPFQADANGNVAFHALGDALQVRAYLGPSGAPTFEKIFTFVANGTAAEFDREKFVEVGTVREKLSATRVYYVNPTTGLNTNNGLSAGAPFLTIQKAIDVCQTLDFGGNAVYIQLAAGTYTGTATFSTPTLGGTITVQGDNTTPSNVLLDGGSGYPLVVTNHGTVVNVTGVKVKTTGASGFAANNGGRIYIVGRVEWGQCAVCMSVDGGFITNFANAAGAGPHCWITGNFSYFARAVNGGKISQNNCNISIPAGTVCSASFLSASTNSIVEAVGNTWTVANVTGTKYLADTGGGVNTFGSGASSIPGTVAGTATAPGFFA